MLLTFLSLMLATGLATPGESALRSGQPEIAAPAWFPKAVPLPPPQGEVIRVATPDELLAAVERVGPGGTILLADGQYRLPHVIVLQGKRNITIRSAAGDPAKVVLSGKGWDSNAKGDDLLHIGRCEGGTIADLTFTDCRSYGIKVEAENAPKDVHIYNCRFSNIGVRAIKGSAGQDPNVHAVKGSVRYCRFENTKVPPADWLYGGDYIAAIDMMALDGWTFSDNVFRNVKGRNGGGRAAIFIWVRSRGVTVERNLIVNCDRGIAFGNPGQSTANRAGERLIYVGDGIIRNNFIAGGPDCGIELWYADCIKVYNNSIWRPERNWSRGIRVGTGTARAEIVNNLVHGEIRLEGGEAQLRQNLAGRLEGYFADPASGDLTLTSATTKAIDQGVSLPEVTDDIRGQPRKGPMDLGAWESDGAQATYTTYGSFAELMAGENARYPKLVRVSDPGTKESPNYTGFFFYQCLQFDPADRYLLGMRVHCQDRDVRPTDRGAIGLIDVQDGYKWTQIGETTAWNWQQGPRLQWRPSSDEILWNDRAEDGTHYVCRVYNFKTGARRTLPRPVYTPSPDGTTALTHDFERMKHGGTPYVGIADKYAGQYATKETGIWRMDLNTGEATLIMSLEKMAQIAYLKGPPSSGCFYVFREGWNPSGSRFIAFLKDPDNQFDKAFSMTPDGTDVRYLYNLPSHHEWRDDRCLLDGRGYYLYEDDGTGKAKSRLFESSYNGHVAYIPGPGGDWIISDTYAVNGYQYLFLYHIPSKRFVPLAKLKSTVPTNAYRVDLHPRLSHDRRIVSIDATHEGLGRQMYVMDIGPILDSPPGGVPGRGVSVRASEEVSNPELEASSDASVPPTYTTYGSFAELMAGKEARSLKLVRISEPGTKENPNYTGFFFYQCLQFDSTDRYVLGMRAHCQNRDVGPTDRAEIGLIDLQNGYKWTQIGDTTAWNWQQGARLQWRPRSDEIVWNDRSDDGKTFVCRVYNFRTGARRTLPRPIYDLSPGGATALTHDFERMNLFHGTEYVGIEYPYEKEFAPSQTGIWKMNMETGKAEMIISLERMASIAYPKGLPASGYLYFFREGWNPSGTRFVAFIKDPANKLFQAYSMASDGTDVRYLYYNPSHHSWQDDNTILDYGRHAPPGGGSPQGGYFLFPDDGTGKAKELLWTSRYDGHDSYVPGPGGDWILSDTYTIGGYQYLFLYHRPTKRFVPLAKLKSTADEAVLDGSCRVDLHPRLSRDGRRVSIDATHEGLGRQMYLLDIGSILDHSPAWGRGNPPWLPSKEGQAQGPAPTDEMGIAPSVKKFGVYEVTLRGDGAVDNPFDAVATVTFTPPSGQANAKTVYAFYDGDNTWRARVYVSEPGVWKWASACQTDKGLDGRSGTFTAQDSNLSGRLLTHPRNPRQWMTEDGRWFLNLNDTAYFLLCTHDAGGQPIPFEDFTAYVRDAVAKGITSLRSFAVCGPKGFQADDTGAWANDVFADAGFTRFRLDRFQGIDRRLQWLLDNYPEVYVQFILFPRGSRWKVDETFWKSLSDTQKERLLRWMVARYAAYPQVFWLIVNDAHYGPEYANNNAFAREVGAYFRTHDPWQHPLSTGHARQVPFYFGGEDWATYLHLEDSYDLGATAYERYHAFAKPVFLGEDRYEQDHFDLDPQDMRYFQRRLFWIWLFAGGSANYGGRWWVLQPYTQTGQRAAIAPWKDATRFTAALTGLNSVPHIQRYFHERRLELSDFEPDHALVRDADGREGIRAPKLMRRGTEEYLVYHPNAAADGRAARADVGRTPRVRLDLSGVAGTFRVEWYRPENGGASDGGTVEGGGRRDLASPWQGTDVVLRLMR